MTSEEDELICYCIGAVGKNLYDKIYELRNRIIQDGLNSLPFETSLDVRNTAVIGKRVVVKLALEALEYLLNNKS